VTQAQPYEFPALGEFNRFGQPLALEAIEDPCEQSAYREAIARGYAEGLAQGRAEAENVTKIEAATARQQGTELGRTEGLTAIQQLTAALGEAFAGFEAEHAALVREAEALCVDLALAIVARLVETNPVRAEFVSRTARASLKVLAPEPPAVIFVNPSDRKLNGKALAPLTVREDDTLASGCVRIEAGRLLVEGGIDLAFEQIRSAVVEVKSRRAAVKTTPRKRK
jgi:flagellar biosynthesis/type III secretory pathway protein FliH